MISPVFRVLFAVLLASGSALNAQTVRFQTNMGDIDVVLMPEAAPLTVKNFLNYVNKSAYSSSIIHRSVPGFIIQGGGYKFSNGQIVEIPADAPVKNEYKVSNTRGTIAMAKLGSDPNSATNEWFFNLADNSSNLDNQNGGFTVFGRVANGAGLAVVDKIAALRTYYANATFSDLPLQNYTGGTVSQSNFVIINSISVLPPAPAIGDGGVITAGAFGGGQTAAPGSLIEIYGANLAGTTRLWADSDFSDGKAPVSIDDVSVTVGGKAAYVNFVSSGQVNVQVPADVTAGSVPVVVTYKGVSSAPASVNIKTTAGGIFAPPSLLVGGKQYAGALRGDPLTVVGAQGVQRGETLVFFGTGFGPVSGAEMAGKIAPGSSTVLTPVEFRFGDITARVDYAGLAPGYVGLYQFNVVVPQAAASGDVALTVLSGGEAIAQKLWIAVK